MSDDTMNLVQVSRPTLRQRFWRRLGFGGKFDEALFDWRNTEPKEGDWWVVGAISTDVWVQVSFLDRLRLLVSGRCEVSVSTRTNVMVDHAESRSQFVVHAPGATR